MAQECPPPTPSQSQEWQANNMAFRTSCPPDIPPKSRIVAVCGITDYNDMASPSKDGRFFSDFYLFYHLLSPPNIKTEAQSWLTTESPADLVKKYGEYAHGDPRGERKVVLEKDTVEQIRQSGRNLRVVDSRAALLERFLSTLREQASLAAERNEQLIVFVFGHGDQDTHGVYLGGEGDSINNLPRLRMSDFRRAVGLKVNVTLFTTACYSGGWLVQPNSNKETFVNMTGITGSGIEQETRSWSYSRSVGRACGSSIASAVMQSIISIDEEKEIDRAEVRNHPTYMSLADEIFQTISKIHPLAGEQQVHFSAQNDEWEAHFGKRTGFSLNRFKDGWDSLRSIPPSGSTQEVGAVGDAAVGHRTGSIQRELRYRATEYLSSTPGRRNLGGNTVLHSRLIRFLSGELQPDCQQSLDLLNQVLYRLLRLQEAEEYVQIMGIDMPSSKEFDVELWKGSPEQRGMKDKAMGYLRRTRLLDPPGPRGGFYYSKPFNYTAIALAESCKSLQAVKDKVSLALKVKQGNIESLLAQTPVQKIIHGEAVRKEIEAFFAAMKQEEYKVHFKAVIKETTFLWPPASPDTPDGS
ncbi:hypothetical protein FQN50_001625 [Emmonsiellopsis sp. PD_5]|nr:hypothetical protein FQN50_001625 [Emmonsiellopsis sp. PD_5]